VATPLEHRGWANVDKPLRIGDQTRLVYACAAVFAPPPDRPQLDLFQDGTVPLLEQEIQRALAERRIERAREQVARLVRQDPHHRRLRGFLRLIQVIDDPDIMTPGDRLQELLAIEPLARELLGHRDRDFLAPLWPALAESLAGRAFEPGAPQLHASFAWARAGRWDAVREAAEHDWRSEPSLLLAYAAACWHRRDLGAARTDWMGCAGSIPWRLSGPSPRPGSPTAGSPGFGTDSKTWTRHWIPRTSRPGYCCRNPPRRLP